MDEKLTVIGKAKLNNIDDVKVWFEAKEAESWINENWPPQTVENGNDEHIGFYTLQSKIPNLHKYLDRVKERWYFNDLIDMAVYYENLGQYFDLLYLDDKERFAIISGADQNDGWCIPCKFLTIQTFRDYGNVEMKSLMAENNMHGKNEIAFASDISTNSIKNDIDLRQEEILAKKKEIEALNKEKEEKIQEFKRQLEEQYRKQNELIEQKKAELEQQKKELEQQLLVLETEIYAIRCLSGEVIKFSKLTDGKSSNEDDPVIVYQKLRFLDEELGKILAIYDVDGTDMGYFEDILKSRQDIREIFAPGDKSVSFVKISRNGIGYHTSDEFANTLAAYKKYHGKTIGIIVKDGENLYIGWTDEDKISLSNDNIFYAPRENKIIQDERIIESSSQKDKISRFFIFSILQGLINDGKIIRLPEKVTVTKPNPHVIFSLADGWIEDNTYGTWQDILDETSGDIAKGDMVLTTQRITRDDAMDYSRNSTRYAAFCNDRGRGEKNRTHDVSITNCKVYPINLIDKDIIYNIFYLEYPCVQGEKYNINQVGDTISYNEKFIQIPGPPKLSSKKEIFEHGTYYPSCCPLKMVNEETICDWVQWYDRYNNREYAIEYKGFTEKKYYRREFYKAEYVGTEFHTFISEAKSDCRGRWDKSVNVARANMEVYEGEFLNLTYLDSVRLRYAITNRKVNTWKINGCIVDYAMALKYLNKALEYILDREKKEKTILLQYAKELPSKWQVQLAVWRHDRGYHSLTNTRAKSFVKYLQKEAANE
jgi:hypothetical protein